ncbi:uncharacterized protein LOC123205801 [Mangifera indica]|uniref:uncharacterized protein LOC123205801 n=1 Tax=Mangifera indica TaxID=29780 RepID=UPI001CF9EE22|nr:uncharacterized protein LOC123205801 [Mangifera indica]
MGEEAPKLYNSKPKKAKLKQFQEQQKGKDFASSTTPPQSSSAAATSYTMGSSSAASPPPPPKESFARRYKFLWPLLLTVNLAVGAYMYMKTSKKDESITEEEGAKDVPSIPVSATAAATAVITENPVAEFVKLREPIPVDQQRELFKWILEEKRKVKPKDPEEKKRIDEEKAILKQFIRAKSIPSI